MTEPHAPSTPTDAAPPFAPRATRRRRLLLAGATAGALAVVGGAAGAVAAAVSHASSGPQTTAPLLFFPAVGQAQAPGGGSGGAAGGMATSMLQAGPAAKANSYAMGAPAFAGDAAMAFPGGSFAYPSLGCGEQQPAQVQGDGITATGIVQVPLGTASSGASTLNVGVQSNGNSDIRSALADVHQRLAAIRDAVRRAGIPDKDISVQNFNAYANGSPKAFNDNVSGSLSVTITDSGLVDRVIAAAVDAGATNLNLWSSGGASAATPSDDQVRTTVTKATSEAHGMALAEAQGAGLTLGAARAVSAQPPSICPWAPGGPELVVAVTVTYAVK
jgi:uncharacterized protein YggE